MTAADASPGLREGESLAQITQLSLSLAFNVRPKLVVGMPVPPSPTSVSGHGAACRAQHSSSLRTVGSPAHTPEWGSALLPAALLRSGGLSSSVGSSLPWGQAPLLLGDLRQTSPPL